MIPVLLVSSFCLPQNVFAQGLASQVRELLRNRIETSGNPPRMIVGEELIHASAMLPLFYERRVFQPAWSNDDGPLPQVNTLIGSIQDALLEGLRPEDYHLKKIEAILAGIDQNQQGMAAVSPGLLADLDLLCTDAFLIYGSHLLSGRVNPNTLYSEWIADRREIDLADVLMTALTGDQIKESLKGLLPPQVGYTRMRSALGLYRDIAMKGGWPKVPGGVSLKKGDSNERVTSLRKRLIVSGDLESDSMTDETFFDEELEIAVKRYQKRHGLTADGIVGPKTISDMNITVDQRIRQIEVNLERWRWLPNDLGRRYIIVNIANFELDVVEDDVTVMTMDAIVGRPYRRTPVFSSKMTYIVLNPYWNVPHSIAVKDILPAVRKDPGYLENMNFKILRGWGAETIVVDPKSIDWSNVSARNFRYRFRQDPGTLNALGSVKFMFPNRFDVYLHDTPARDLFVKPERAFSSGCIRLSKAGELTEYVLRENSKWTGEKIAAAIENGAEQTIRLPEPIPVHLLYWTAWYDEEGPIQFRRDIYDRDSPLLRALYEEPPGND